MMNPQVLEDRFLSCKQAMELAPHPKAWLRALCEETQPMTPARTFPARSLWALGSGVGRLRNVFPGS